MADSIYNTIRSSKVSVGNAPLFQGMRIFDDRAMVCPRRANISDYGVVDVPRDSINTLTAGCYSALDRMTVENLQRPRYSTYLNAEAIDIPGIGDSDLYSSGTEEMMQSKPFYDTQLGYQYVRPVVDKSILSPEFASSDISTKDGAKNAQVAEGDYINCIVSRKYDNRNCNPNL